MIFDGNAELHIKGLEIDWDKIGSDSYLREIPSIAKVDDIRFNRQITFFVGENGSGKSTLLEAIAVAYGFNPEGGTRNYSFYQVTDMFINNRDRILNRLLGS